MIIIIISAILNKFDENQYYFSYLQCWTEKVEVPLQLPHEIAYICVFSSVHEFVVDTIQLLMMDWHRIINLRI